MTRLTQNEEDWAPSWSPDGRRIVFVSYRDGNSEIFVMNVDGSGVTRLIDTEAWEYDPRSSPDDRRIVFVSSRDENLEIYVMDADGSDVTRLTDNNVWTTEHPSWSPDGPGTSCSSQTEMSNL